MKGVRLGVDTTDNQAGLWVGILRGPALHAVRMCCLHYSLTRWAEELLRG